MDASEEAQYETETTFTYNKLDKTVTIFSAWPKDQRKIELSGVKPYAGTPENGLFYRVPLSLFRWKVVPAGRVKKQVGFAIRKPVLAPKGGHSEAVSEAVSGSGQVVPNPASPTPAVVSLQSYNI